MAPIKNTISCTRDMIWMLYNLGVIKWTTMEPFLALQSVRTIEAYINRQLANSIIRVIHGP